MTTVILIRHAEKLAWVNGEEPTKKEKKKFVDDGMPSDKGFERSDALVSYFLKRDEMQRIFEKRPLAGLVAQDSDPTGKSAKSMRPKLTLVPLSKALPDIPFALFLKDDRDKAIEYLKNNFAGKSVIICWSHDDIDVFVRELGKPKFKTEWPDGRYDVTWVLDTETGKFEEYAQKLLYGDEDL